MMSDKIHHSKIIVCMILLSLYLLPTVSALGLSPLNLEVTVKKGEETTVSKNIEVTNPSENSIHVTGSASGTVAQFITLEPKEFDLPAGPGLMNPGERPSTYIKVNFNIPREISGNVYTGEIVFTQQAVGGGTIGTASQLGLPVKLTIGTMAKAVFPMYMNVLTIILIIILIVSIFYRKRGR